MNAPKKLPAWVSTDPETGQLIIDPEEAYPHYLGMLELPADKYGAEVARRCAIEDLKTLCGIPLLVKIKKREAWALKNLEGTDEQAVKGANDFAKHYDKLTKYRAAQVMASGEI